MVKIILITLGSLSFGLGVLGIFVVGLPTTPFLLLSASLYAGSSQRLYNWLINHKIFGAYIKRFRERKAMSLKEKILSMTMMWSMIGISCYFLRTRLLAAAIVIAAGITGTVVMGFIIPTYKDKNNI